MRMNTARVALLTIAMGLGQSVSAAEGTATLSVQKIDLSPGQERIRAPSNEAAIAKIPPGFKFAQPGKFTVGISIAAGAPQALLASDDKTIIGVEADIAQLVADGLGLPLNLVLTSWEDWPLGVTSGKYDAVISGVTVTEVRKKRFDFATYRQDIVGFYVKSGSKIASISEAKDIAGLKVIVGSGTNQEKVLLAWNEANEKAGIKPALLQYYDDLASAQLALQSGRVDAVFGTNAIFAYSASLTGGIKLVGIVNGGWPRHADIATVTRKGNGLVNSVNATLAAVIASGQYEQVFKRWGLDVERVTQSQINPPGLSD